MFTTSVSSVTIFDLLLCLCIFLSGYDNPGHNKVSMTSNILFISLNSIVGTFEHEKLIVLSVTQFPVRYRIFSY